MKATPQVLQSSNLLPHLTRFLANEGYGYDVLPTLDSGGFGKACVKRKWIVCDEDGVPGEGATRTASITTTS